MDDPKLSAVLVFFVANYFMTFLIIGLLAALISLINKPKPLTINLVAEAFFSYYLLFTIGINNLVNFVAHVFFGDFSAEFIGWPNSPFQAEVGFARQACRFDLQRSYRLLRSRGAQLQGTFTR